MAPQPTRRIEDGPGRWELMIATFNEPVIPLEFRFRGDPKSYVFRLTKATPVVDGNTRLELTDGSTVFTADYSVKTRKGVMGVLVDESSGQLLPPPSLNGLAVFEQIYGGLATRAVRGSSDNESYVTEDHSTALAEWLSGSGMLFGVEVDLLPRLHDSIYKFLRDLRVVGRAGSTDLPFMYFYRYPMNRTELAFKLSRHIVDQFGK
jgi:hypothetical protein